MKYPFMNQQNIYTIHNILCMRIMEYNMNNPNNIMSAEVYMGTITVFTFNPIPHIVMDTHHVWSLFTWLPGHWII